MSTAEAQRADLDIPPVSTAGRGMTLGLFRIALGWLLLWAGLDKLLGLGFPTERAGAVINGASATEGYLTYGLAPDSLAADLLGPLAGNPVADALYLLGAVGGGLALILGIGVRLAAIGGAILFLLLWFTAFPLEYNPVLDQHSTLR